MRDQTEAEAPPVRFLTLPETLQRVRLGKTAMYAKIGAGSFPMPVRIGTKSMFVEHEVDEWMREQVAKRPATLLPPPAAIRKRGATEKHRDSLEQTASH